MQCSMSQLGLALIPSYEEGWISPPALRSPLDLIFLEEVSTIFQIINYWEVWLDVSNARCNCNTSVELMVMRIL